MSGHCFYRRIMMKELMKGNEAAAAAAIYAGVKCYFGYPITPQTEIAAYMAKHLPESGGVFLQAESEISAINMVYGAAGAGVRVMTSSSGPGISLKQEGISYIAAADLPCVIINVMRGGPGLGGIQASQADYFQAVKGGGHGDYRLIVLAPSSVAEMAELTVRAFELSDEWRIPVMILSDGVLGQMMEAVDMDRLPPVRNFEKPWAADGRRGRAERNIINTLFLEPEELESRVMKRHERYKKAEDELQKWEEYMADDADIIVTAYGITARIALAAVKRAREAGVKAGFIRPISLWPFPKRAYDGKNAVFLCAEMSTGQMIEDVRLALEGRCRTEFFGRTGGVLPKESEIFERILEINGEAHE
mgnify:FL=1